MRDDAELEADVLAAVLSDPSLVPTALRLLDEEDFHGSGHRELFGAVARVARRDGPAAVSPSVVRDELAREGKDPAALVEVLGSGHGLGGRPALEARARRLRALRRQRVLARALADVAALPDPDEAVARAEEAVREITRLGATRRWEMAELVDQLLDERERELQRQARVSTGLPGLDRPLGGGVAPGWFVVVGARTGVGKTTLLVQLATQALRAGQRVLYASLEEPATAIAERVVRRMRRAPRQAGVDDPLFSAGVDPEVRALRFVVETTPELSAICAAAEEEALGDGLGLVLVDYLQLVRVQPRASSRVQELEEVTSTLKTLAMSLGVPVVGAAQVNRAPMARADTRPHLHDLRDSGSLEQDADVVVLLHRGDPAAQVGELRLAKNRYGPPAELRVRLDYALGRIAEVTDVIEG